MHPRTKDSISVLSAAQQGIGNRGFPVPPMSSVTQADYLKYLPVPDFPHLVSITIASTLQDHFEKSIYVS